MDIEKELLAIGGKTLVSSYQQIEAKTEVISLASADLDSIAVGYSLAIGAAASALDLILDRAFRNEMQELHRERSPEEQSVLEKSVADLMKDLKIPAGGDKGDPDMAMDWYKTLNDILNLKKGFRLRPANHRILNHTDESTVIQMLMNGEVGIGSFRLKLYPKMTYEEAKSLFDAHIAADRGTRQSLPLSFMSWFWEQGIKSANPETAGQPHPIYKFMSEYMPNVDWSKWVKTFFGENVVIPEGATFGEVMMKLYETGVLNERVFWTSDLGAAVGGLKRRAMITVVMEVGVEIYAFLEGLKLGFIKFNEGIDSITEKFKIWRDQPKYLDMKILAQSSAVAGGLTRAAIKGDVLNINFFSVAMLMKHLWVAPALQSRHYNRLIEMSAQHSNQLLRDFTATTGIYIRPKLTVIKGGLSMTNKLDNRLHKAGCQSTRVRVLASRYPDRLEPCVALYEKFSPLAEDDLKFQDKFDALCESWYLSKVEDDEEAIKTLQKDLNNLQKLL